MVERNMIKEGFVKNSVTVSGTVSGTQVVTIPQINVLVDENIAAVALTITGSEFIALDADMGARWKLEKIEYHTDAASTTGLTMLISDDDIDYFEVTMTGSPPLYVGDISPTTVSGAPRFIRVVHSGSVDVDVFEWRAINDDTLVDFGADRSQEELTIADAPIGRPSDQVERLTLFNAFPKQATGFLYIEESGTDADAQIEVALKEAGPYVSRNTSTATQPDTTDWEEGQFLNTLVISSGSYFVDFTGGFQGWETEDMSLVTVTGGAIVGISNDFTPAFKIKNDFGQSADEPATQIPGVFAFRADDYDTVEVSLRVPFIDRTDFVEGPRLFWNTQDDVADFETARSVAAFTAGANFKNAIEKYTFNVGNLTTWSGAVRAFKVQPFTTSTGISIPAELYQLNVAHSSKKERVGLTFSPVNSGTFAPMTKDLTVDSPDTAESVLDFRHRIKEPCIVTRVQVLTAVGASRGGVFLCTITGTDFPNPGSNFLVKQRATIPENNAHSEPQVFEMNVFWSAEPGDIIGYTTEGAPGSQDKRFIVGDTDDAFLGDTTVGLHDFGTIGDTQDDLDASTFTSNARNYSIKYDSISAGSYISSGRYTTPVFDVGTVPALATVAFESDQPAGTSIDVDTGTAFNTVNARASDVPPRTSVDLGEVINAPRFINAGAHVNSNISGFAINAINENVTTREGFVALPNTGGAAFYHESKNELWILNLLISGSVTTDLRPTWDALDIDTGNYLRTQHVTGEVTYSFQGENSDDFKFEPVAFIPNYDDGEIYIIGREPAFFIGASSYYGIILDLEGNFKDVFWRNGSVGEPSGASDDRFETMQNITFDGTNFYILSDTAKNTGALPDDMERLGIYRFGGTDSTSAAQVTFLDEIVISSIPGLAFTAGAGPDPRCIAYNSRDDNYYLLLYNVFGTEGVDNRVPELITIDITNDGSDNFTASVTSVSGTSEGLANRLTAFTLSAGFESSDRNDEWDGIIDRRLQWFTDMTYVSNRDSFVVLQNRRSERGGDFTGEGQPQAADFDLFRAKTLSFYGEIGAGIVTSTVFPAIPSPSDELWGTLSGTLAFDEVQENSPLFPVGRFVQVEYTLNSDLERIVTPQLSQSHLPQGLRLGEIPGSGTKDIFVRTNIPEGTSTALREGSLKVFWELEE